MSCTFCDLQVGKVLNRIIEETSDTLIFLSNPCKMPGHLLVVPKRHVETLSELTDEELMHVMKQVAEYQNKIIERITPGCDVRQHYQPYVADSEFKVSHLHFHLQPRSLNDEMYEKSGKFENPLFYYLSEEERERITQLLK